MYHKSPFPYVFLLLGIISISFLTNFTLDKEIEQPLIFRVKNSPEKQVIEKAKTISNTLLENKISEVKLLAISKAEN